MSQDPRHLMDTVFKRVEFLESLKDDPAEKRDLVDRIGVSRSTVNRAIRDLEQCGLVGYRDGGYQLTVSGHLLYDQYSRYQTAVRAIVDANSLLQFIPAAAPLSVDFLRGADVVTAENPASHIPATTLTDAIRGADRIRGISRTHAAAKTDDALHNVITNGGTVEIVFREEVYEHILSAYDWVADRVESGDYRPYVTDDLPYGLAIADHGDETVACLIVYDDTSVMGVIVNDTDAAIEWATATVEAFREKARRVPDREAQ
ncbi:GntR family transcriptional regulator [Halostella sp. JP-L12]|uniref:helix-turn-helix transcriptional regulator n=1 Tax=Halostella TaxID=1843185 RepID=UPI000EF76D97|nr:MULTISPECIES: winged helix-turn-helix transcriptional regulator [Halostella]NHN46442.1 GntR family transcriptional regulator [Halostella sp. JP-L12]